MLAMALLLPEGHLGGLGGSAGGVGGSVEGPIEPESDSVSIHLNFADEFWGEWTTKPSVQRCTGADLSREQAL